jgi:DNA-binding transcriptional LysR family regulator
MQHRYEMGLPMDFTALRYFSATAHSRSIRAASERLHVSPSAISRQIAKLEHELRAPIFDRRAQGMKLTPAGEILLSKIDGVMREFSRVKSHIAALQDLQAGNVDIYCFQTAIESFVAPVLNRFHVQYPDVTFNVRMSSTDEAIEA